MKPVTHQSLGIVIAYLLPGFAALAALSLHSSTVHAWFDASGRDAPTVGGFLYVTVASLGLGLFLNSARGLTLDPLYHRLGVRKHSWDYSRLQANIVAVEFILTQQFRHYQFTGNMLAAVLIAYPLIELSDLQLNWTARLALFASGAVLFLSAKRLLQNYYRRLDEILGALPQRTKITAVELPELAGEMVDRKDAVGYDQ